MVQSEPHSYLKSLLQATRHSNAFSHSTTLLPWLLIKTRPSLLQSLQLD